MHTILKICCTVGLVLLANFALSQSNVLDKKMDCTLMGQPLAKLLSYLEDEHQIKFSYATESVKNISIQKNYLDIPLRTILSETLSPAGIDYKLYDDVVMLRKSKSYSELSDAETYKKSLHLKGKITDKLSSEDLPAATVSIFGTSIGTYSDEEGHFDIEISEDYLDKQLIIQYLGYEPQKFEIMQLDDSFLLVPLSVSDIGIDEIIIVNRDIPIKISDEQSSYTLSNQVINSQTSSLAGSDPIKNVQLLPGINAFDDTSSEIKIRGSNSDETLVILDGIPLYNLDHYYGIFSNVNSNFVEEVNIYKNDIPIRFTEKTAGVVEMKSKVDQQPELSAIADINLLTASVNLTAPLSSKSMFLLGGRTTYKNVSNTSFNSVIPMREIIRTQNFTDQFIRNSADPSFNFRDINAKLILNPVSNTKIMFSFFNSLDKYENDFENENANDRVVSSTENEEEWKNLGAGINLETEINSTLSLSSNLYYSNYQSESSLAYQVNRSRLDSMREMQGFNSSRENQIQDLGANIILDKKINNGILSSGLSTSLVDAAYEFEVNGARPLSGGGQVATFSGFGSYLYNPNDKFSFQLSGKGSYYTGTEKFYFSPRVSSTFRLNDQFTIKGAFGIYQQFVRELNYENNEQTYEMWVLAEQDNRIPVITSQNAMLGFTYKNNKVSFDAEFYHKDIDGMIEFAVADPRSSELDLMRPRAYLLVNGVGYSKGVDLLLGYNHHHFDTYLAYTLSKVEHSYRQIDKSRYFAAEDDRRHQLSWINQVHFGNLSLNANWVYNTGRWYTDLTTFEQDETTSNKNPRNKLRRLAPYNRIDFGVNYRLQLDKTKVELGASVFNLLNNDNVKFQQTIESKFEEDRTPINTFHSTETSLLAKTFNLNLKFYFN